jgi:membrane fusion protein, copper/silver efflux system
MTERPTKPRAAGEQGAPGPLASEDGLREGKEAPPPGVLVMAIVRWAILAVMALIAAASLYAVLGQVTAERGDLSTTYYCPMHPQVVQDRPGECPICNMTLVKREPGAGATPSSTMSPSRAPSRAHGVSSAHGSAMEGHARAPHASFACPMHPEQTGDSADDRCPLCGMALVAAAAHDEPPHQSPPDLTPIELSLDRVQRIGMKTEKVTQGTLANTVRAFFTIVPAEGATASVQTRYAGWIQELHVDESGATVRKGQLLARVYSPELLAAQQELLNAKQWSGSPQLGGGAVMLENARKRLVLLGMPRAQVESVERAGEVQQLVEVRAESGGFVAEKRAAEGQYVQPGTELFRITDLSRVWAIAELFERDASALRVGQAATLALSSAPEESFAGKVALIYPTLDGASRTVRARIDLDNRKRKLMPGMFGEVTLDVAAREGLTIPREALVDVGPHQYVFVEHAPGHFEPRTVRPGLRHGDRVEVRAGLREGETVVTTGNFLLDSESRLRTTLAGGATASEHAH